MKRGFVKSSRYSPGNMDGESLERLFVGRHKILDDLVNKIHASVTTEQKHYILIVGPRGCGKTHLVTLAYHRIKENPEDASKLLIALLNEEEWGVASYLDFLVRILRSLANESTEIDGSDVEEIYARFSENPEVARDHAESLIRRVVGTKTLLLICENLVDLFDGLDEEGQKRWRSFIQESGFWTIIATTPAIFSGIKLQDCPFYGFFTIKHLTRIDFETALELLIKKSKYENKIELARFLQTPIGRARVRAIHHLAGGNHRVYVVMFDFLDKESLDDLVEPFLRMVDDLTPYYQDRMRQIAPAKRKIVEFLCKTGHPVTIKEIATPCLMSHQTAAKQIGELAAEGFITKTRSGRNTFCELSEPLMRICIEVKDNRAEHLGLFVEFLRHWYSNRELRTRLAMLPHEASTAHLDRAHVYEAVRCYEEDRHEPFLDALREESGRCIADRDWEGLLAIQGKLVEETGDPRRILTPIIALRDKGEEELALKVGQVLCQDFGHVAHLHFELACTHWELDQIANGLMEIDRAIELDPNAPEFRCVRGSLLWDAERYEDILENEKVTLKLDPNHSHSYSMIVRSLTQLGRYQEAVEYGERLLKAEPESANAFVDVGGIYFYQDDYETALHYVTRAVELAPENYMILRARALINFEAEDFESAETDLRKCIELEPESVSAHCRLSDTLFSLGKFKEAAQIARKLLEIDPDHFHANIVIFKSFVELGDTDAGLDYLTEGIDSVDPESLALTAELLLDYGRAEDAKLFVDRALTIDSKNADAWIANGSLQIRKRDYESAFSSAERAKSLGAKPERTASLTSQSLAGRSPLQDSIRELLKEIENSSEEPNYYSDDLALCMLVSAREFGPKYFVGALREIAQSLDPKFDLGVIAAVLTDFLSLDLREVSGSEKEWAIALAVINEDLSSREECNIPLNMISAAVLYQVSGDKTHLLALPVEQRALLKEDLGILATENRKLH